MKAKEWAKANGFPNVTLGKGRMPSDARAAVEAYVASGGLIEGYSVKASLSTDKPATVERVSATAKVVDADVEETVPERFNVAMVGDASVCMRTVCDVCKRSLNFHICESPKVTYKGVSSVVVFKSRKNPETFRPNKWW